MMYCLKRGGGAGTEPLDRENEKETATPRGGVLQSTESYRVSEYKSCDQKTPFLWNSKENNCRFLT
jgi:hypothetical protein